MLLLCRLVTVDLNKDSSFYKCTKFVAGSDYYKNRTFRKTTSLPSLTTPRDALCITYSSTHEIDQAASVVQAPPLSYRREYEPLRYLPRR